MTDTPDYEVGYGKPPVATRFKAGNKGGGRKKGAKGFAASVKKLLRQPIRVTEGGKTRSVTMLDALLLKLRNEAVSGDQRAIATMLALAREHAPGDLPDAIATSESDAEIIAGYFARNARSAARDSETNNPDTKKNGDD